MLTIELVKGFNRQVLTALPLPANVVPGEIRKTSVVVGSYRGAPVEDCEYLLGRMCDFIASTPTKDVELDRVSKAVLLAIWAHLYLAWIHPFDDGNWRTARLVKFMRRRAGRVEKSSHLAGLCAGGSAGKERPGIRACAFEATGAGDYSRGSRARTVVEPIATDA